MNTAEITIPLGKLVPSMANVRRVNSEMARAELAASIGPLSRLYGSQGYG
ncbi:hypothetical protein NKH52_28440 [Mesorhizobium sp. M1066]